MATILSQYVHLLQKVNLPLYFGAFLGIGGLVGAISMGSHDKVSNTEAKMTPSDNEDYGSRDVVLWDYICATTHGMVVGGVMGIVAPVVVPMGIMLAPFVGTGYATHYMLHLKSS